MKEEKIAMYMSDLEQNDVLEKEPAEYSKDELKKIISELNK